jgi:hypothetical protein
MLLLRTSRQPQGDDHIYELFDKYRCIVSNMPAKSIAVTNNRDFNARYSAMASALTALPNAREHPNRPTDELIQDIDPDVRNTSSS